jgi:hypothetical protein
MATCPNCGSNGYSHYECVDCGHTTDEISLFGFLNMLSHSCAIPSTAIQNTVNNLMLYWDDYEVIEDYEPMMQVLHNIYKRLLFPLLEEMFPGIPTENLTDDERIELWASMPKEDRYLILDNQLQFVIGCHNGTIE